MKTYAVAVVIITHNRVEDARINMELMRHIWTECLPLDRLDIFHIFNGQKSWYPQKTHEDVLMRIPNRGHFMGAVDMMNVGAKAVLASRTKYDAVVVCSADAWLMDPGTLQRLLEVVTGTSPVIASSWWHVPGLVSTEWLMLNPTAIKFLFPLEPQRWFSTVVTKLTWTKFPFVELAFGFRCLRQQIAFRPIPGRSWVHPFNRFYSPTIRYFSHHDLEKKRQLFNQLVDAV